MFRSCMHIRNVILTKNLPGLFFPEHVWERIKSWFECPWYIKGQYWAVIILPEVEFPGQFATSYSIESPGPVFLTWSLSLLRGFLMKELFLTVRIWTQTSQTIALKAIKVYSKLLGFNNYALYSQDPPWQPLV